MIGRLLSELTKASPQVIDRSHECPYLCGYNRAGTKIYLDKRLNPKFKLKDGREVDGTKYLAVHEATEKALEDKFGYSYQHAHEIATGKERQAVEADGIPWAEYQDYMLKEVKKLTKLDGLVPKDIDLKPERDYGDKHMIKEAEKHGAKPGRDVKKSFLDALIGIGDLTKGGPGSGVKGHTTARKPYPGQDTRPGAAKDAPQSTKSYMPPEGTEHHYADSPALRAYKNIMRAFKKRGELFQGNITYDPKTDQVKAISPKGMQVIKEIIAEYQAGQKGDGKGKAAPEKEG